MYNKVEIKNKLWEALDLKEPDNQHWYENKVTWIKIGIGVLVVVSIGGLYYYFKMYKNDTPNIVINNDNSTPTGDLNGTPANSPITTTNELEELANYQLDSNPWSDGSVGDRGLSASDLADKNRYFPSPNQPNPYVGMQSKNVLFDADLDSDLDSDLSSSTETIKASSSINKQPLPANPMHFQDKFVPSIVRK